MTGDAPRTVDAELVERLRAGDTTAYEELYRQHGTRLFNLAYRILGHADDAQDQLQDIFLQVFKRIDSFKGDSSLSTWMHRLAMNLCLDRLRSKAGKADRRTGGLDDAGPVKARPGALEQTVHRLDLERAIATLPDGCRAAFLLHDVEGFEHREVGKILGVSEGTSKSQVHKARLRIREHLLSIVGPQGVASTATR